MDTETFCYYNISNWIKEIAIVIEHSKMIMVLIGITQSVCGFLNHPWNRDRKSALLSVLTK